MLEVEFILHFTKYKVQDTIENCNIYLELVKWWDSLNATQRHHCFERYENKGLYLNFKTDALNSYLKIYKNELINLT